jgi:ferredoxin/flavodoxin---NADP+ reductase
VIAAVAAAHPAAFTAICVVSRDGHPGALTGRIPDLIRGGQLEARAGEALTPEGSHAMLCGNPAMVEDTQKALEERGMRRHRRKQPGHITVETYW